MIAARGLSAALVLASCSQTGPASSTLPSASSSTPTQTSAPKIRQIDITVTGKKVNPPPAMVNLAVGESLAITVMSDHDNTLHAHGFDIEQVVKAGQRLHVTAKGSKPGVYDVELHDPELRLLQVAVR